LLAELHDTRMDLGLPVVAVPPRRTGPDQDATRPVRRTGGPAGPLGSVPPVGSAAGRHAVGGGPPGRPPLVGPPGAGRPAAAGLAGSGIAATADATTAPTHGPQFRGAATQHTAIQRAAVPEPAAAAGARRRPLSRRQRARRRSVLVILLILLLGLLTGYGAWYFAVGRYHQVPNLSGQAQSLAVQELRSDGFTVNPVVDTAYSETAPSGIVVGTHPDAGTHLLGGKSVQLVISKGAERFTVPSVAGRGYDQAQQAFAALPVRLNRQDAADGTGKIPAGSVIRTDPAAGSKVRRDATVTVYVSTGPPIVQVPKVTGQPQGTATGTLTAAQFTVKTSQDYSTTVPAGSVISQDPPAGASVPKFSTVNLVISQGPPLVTLPQISNGTSLAVARAMLENLHLKVKVKRVFGGFLDTVVGMDPKAGSQVPVGSQVTLTVV
jgi:serine/threonine-protein kinase